MARLRGAGLLWRAGLGMTVVLVAATAVPVEAGAISTSGTVERLAGLQPAPLSASGAWAEGPAAAGRTLRLRVDFVSPEQSELHSEADAIADPSSPAYRHYLTVSQFRSLFAPPASTVATVNSYLAGLGVTAGPLDPNGMSEPISGPLSVNSTRRFIWS